jgi:cytoskeleton protein RodZ
MMNNMPKANQTEGQNATFGACLQSARESMGLDRKDVAAQLRLSERVIEILETEQYPADLPVTFIRGYIRSYGKLLQIADADIQKALEPIQPPVKIEKDLNQIKEPIAVTSKHYSMQLSTYAISGTVIALVGLWWYNHSPAQTAIQTEIQSLALQPAPTNDNANQPQQATIATAETGTNAPQANAPNATAPAATAQTPAAAAKTPAIAANNAPAINPPKYATNHKQEPYDDYDDDESHEGSSD